MTRVVTITLTPGVPWVEWCDRCLRSHAWIRVYDANRPHRPPIGTYGVHS